MTLSINSADFSDIDVPVTADLENDTATRETGFSISSSDVALASLSTPQTPSDILAEAVADNLYYNIHTNDFGGGEIRGQLITQSDETVDGVRTVTLTADLDSAQEPGPTSDSEATGTGTVIITEEDGVITYSSDLSVTGLATSDLLPVAVFSAIHLHNAPAGQNGPVITDIVQDAGGDVNGVSADTDDGNVFDEVIETIDLTDVTDVTGSDDADILIGDDADNVLVGNGDNDNISGGAGNDELLGGGGNDTLSGGTGDDTLAGGGGTDVIDGGEGIDTNSFDGIGLGVTATLNADGTGTAEYGMVAEEFTGIENLTGSANDDVLIATGAAANVISGGEGDDFIAGGGGTDTLDGGDGNDTNSFQGIGPDVVASLSDGTAVYVTPNGTVSETFENFENLDGSDSNDSLTGDDNDNILTGNAGNDTLTGGDGDDVLAGGGGTDVIDGGDGIDTNSFDGIGLGVTATLNADGTGTAEYGMVAEEFTGIENLTGSANDDVLIATGAAANVLSGGAGDDLLAGGGGTDTIDGGEGNDTNSFQGIGLGVTASIAEGTAVYGMVNETFVNIENLLGSDNNDVLTGDSFDNVISGAAGNDILSGGAGNDTIDGGEGFDTADFSDLPSDVVLELDEDGNGTATRESGFSVSSEGQPFASLTTDQSEDDLIEEAINNRLYYNIHTTAFPGGEIRGQLNLTSDETVDGVRTIVLDAELDGAQEPDDASDSPAVGQGQVIIIDDGETVTYSSDLSVSGIVVEDLLPVAGVSAIHLHNGEAGVNGPVITDIVQDAGGDVTGASADTPDGNVFEETFETDELISIESVILADGDISVEGAFAAAAADFDGANFVNVDDGDQFVFEGGAPFSSADIVVDGQSVTVPGATFTVDATLTDGNFLAATNDGQTTVVQFVDELLGDGLDLIEGEAVSDEEIDGIAFEEFVSGNGTSTEGTDFTITLDNSTSGFENSFGVFVFDTETGAVSDAQIVAANAQDGGSITVEDVAEGEQVGFFVVQDGNDAVTELGDSFEFDFGAEGAVISGADDLEIFQSIDASLNSDGAQHFLSGSDDDGILRVGIEDLTGLGDRDFQDVVFTIERTESFDNTLAIV